MTEKWASFHEENPEAVEPKVAKVKARPKAAVKKKSPKEKKTKETMVGRKEKMVRMERDKKGEMEIDNE